MSRTPSLAAAVLIALAPLTGCRDRSERPYSTASIELLERLDEATVVCPTLERLARGTPPDTESLLVDDSFEDGLTQRWLGATVPAGEDPADGRPVALVSARTGRLVRHVRLTTGAMHVVTARVRAFGEWTDDGARPGVWVRSLPRPPTADEIEEGTWAELIDSAGAWQTELLGPDDGNGWREIAIPCPDIPERHGLEIALVGGDDVAMLVDEVRVRRLSRLEQEVLRRPEARVTNALLRVRLDTYRDRRDALVLPGESAVTFRIRVPRRRPRLDTATALLPGAVSDATLRVMVDGREVATRREAPLPHARTTFRPWVVRLDRFAGREVELTLAVDGPTDGEVAWGTPRVLATPKSRPGPNLVLISFDTLRADMVGALEGGHGLTPSLDAFASRGTAFDRAMTVGAYTLPSHATMMTGQHPLEHGATEAPNRLDPTHSPILAARLAERGWLTAAYTGGGFLDPLFGFAHGFSLYSTRDPGLGDEGRHISTRHDHVLAGPRSASSDRLRPVLDHLARVDDQPFFLFVHTFVVHNYLPHEEFLEPPEIHPELADVPGSELYRRASAEFDPAATARLRWLYRATVRQADALVFRPLMAQLDALGLTDDTVVAVVSDHGEQFLEHGEVGHFGFLWAENLRVPLLLRGPGVPAGERVSDLVTLRRLAPTLTALLGVPEDPRVTGRPLLGEDAVAPPDQDIVWEHPVRWSAYVHGDWKLVRDAPSDGDERLHLFRIDLDPREARDLATERPNVVDRLLERLAKRTTQLRESAPAPAPTDQAGLDAEIEASLRALGYLGDD